MSAPPAAPAEPAPAPAPPLNVADTESNTAPPATEVLLAPAWLSGMDPNSALHPFDVLDRASIMARQKYSGA